MPGNGTTAAALPGYPERREARGENTAVPPSGSLPSFENAYGGVPTWDIGRPQGAVVRLAETGLIRGSVLDVGCGTGDNALYLASRGHDVVGIDFAAGAVKQAVEKARARGLPAIFVVGDALDAASLEAASVGHTLDTIIDIGLFHCLQPWERDVYAAGLRGVIGPAGHCFVLCWSNENPFGRGPSGITRRALRGVFRSATGWRVESIEREVLETRLPEGQVLAWLARLAPR